MTFSPNISEDDLKKMSAKQLHNEWRLAFIAWYNLKKGRSNKFTEREIISTTKRIYKEINRRIDKGEIKHKFDESDMSPISKSLFEVVKEHAEKKITPVSKTYATGIDAEVGDKLELNITDISEYTDGKQVWFNCWAPIVIGITNKPTTSVNELHKLVLKTTGRIEEEKFPEKFEFAKKMEYVIQAHFYEDSVHADFRFEQTPGSKHLEGMTGAIQEEKKLKTLWNLKDKKLYWGDEYFWEIFKWDASKAIRNKVFKWYKDLLTREELWKVNPFTGDPKIRPGTDNGKPVEKIWATVKYFPPREWLNIEGVVKPVAVANKEGTVDRINYPSVFVQLDRGTFYKGSEKKNFKEYFLNGNWKGRIVFREIEGKKGKLWQYWQPDNSTPYIATKRSYDKNYLPDGYSALPEKIEKLIPKNLNYWNQNVSRKERRSRHKQVIEFWKELEKNAKSCYNSIFESGKAEVKKYPSGIKYCEWEGFKFLEQNPNKDSPTGKLAKEGKKILWILKNGIYIGVVIDKKFMLLP